MKRKRYIEAAKKVNSEKLYSALEAIQLVEQTATAKFDETVEAHFDLGIDPKQGDQLVRGTVQLPHGSGRSVRVVVITQGDKVKEAKDAGADHSGSDDLIEKIQGGWLDFDLVIASPDVMAKVGKLGKALGTKGLMPSPKNGTVTPEIGKAVKEFKSGKVQYSNDKNGVVHLIVGKKSFGSAKLRENFETVYDAIVKAKPAKSKGVYLLSVSLASTMGPGVKLETQKTKWKD